MAVIFSVAGTMVMVRDSDLAACMNGRPLVVDGKVMRCVFDKGAKK